MESNTYYAAHFLGKPKTAGYKPAAFGGMGMLMHGGTTQGQPGFTVSDVPHMLRDPMVSFGLRILRAPLYAVKWRIRCNNKEAQQFIHAQLVKFWKRDLVKALRMLEYGVAGGELLYTVKNDRIVYDGMREVHPFELRPLILDKRFYGVRALPIQSDGRPCDLAGPRGIWFANDAKFGLLWGQSRLAGAWEPWMEKRGKKGAADIRRTWYLKNAYRGARIRYPNGYTPMSDGTERHNQDLARELVEKAETGHTIALPNTVVGPMSDKYQWEWEDAQIQGDISGVREYCRDLDEEILVGQGIPIEVVRASETGSGYAGRAVPAQVFYRSEDEIVFNVIGAFDRTALRPLVSFNYGEDTDYVIEPVSLAELMMEQYDKGQPGQTPPAGLLPTSRGGREPSPWQPDPNERSPQRVVNPVTGQHAYKQQFSTAGSSSGNGDRTPRPLKIGDRIRRRAARLADALFTKPAAPASEPN